MSSTPSCQDPPGELFAPLLHVKVFCDWSESQGCVCLCGKQPHLLNIQSESRIDSFCSRLWGSTYYLVQNTQLPFLNPGLMQQANVPPMSSVLFLGSDEMENKIRLSSLSIVPPPLWTRNSRFSLPWLLCLLLEPKRMTKHHDVSCCRKDFTGVQLNVSCISMTGSKIIMLNVLWGFLPFHVYTKTCHNEFVTYFFPASTVTTQQNWLNP